MTTNISKFMDTLIPLLNNSSVLKNTTFDMDVNYLTVYAQRTLSHDYCLFKVSSLIKTFVLKKDIKAVLKEIEEKYLQLLDHLNTNTLSFFNQRLLRCEMLNREDFELHYKDYIVEMFFDVPVILYLDIKEDVFHFRKFFTVSDTAALGFAPHTLIHTALVNMQELDPAVIYPLASDEGIEVLSPDFKMTNFDTPILSTKSKHGNAAIAIMYPGVVNEIKKYWTQGFSFYFSNKNACILHSKSGQYSESYLSRIAKNANTATDFKQILSKRLYNL